MHASEDEQKTDASLAVQMQGMPLLHRAEADWLMQQRVERIEDLLQADGVQEQGGESERSIATMNRSSRVRGQRSETREPIWKLKKELKRESAGDDDPKEERAVAVDPEGKERRQAPEPARIARSAQVNDQQLEDQEKIADHLRANREADGGRRRKSPSAPRKLTFGVSGIEGAERIAGDEDCGREETQPEHQAGVAGPVGRRRR